MRLWRRGGARRGTAPPASVDWLVVGLGNPGARYEDTRHNVGRAVVLEVARRHGVALDQLKHQARFGRGHIDAQRVCLATPTVYMNESGRAVAPLARFYGVPPERLLLVFDDLDLPLGALRVRASGGAGGHNGVASVLGAMGDGAVPRVRVGIGRPPPAWDPADFVLSRFAPAEQAAAGEAIAGAADAVEMVVRVGLDQAMNAVN